ncbi:unnamed protein product [Darwinula stevensoni]|uniref:Uncharacterized protein n=1 Tax=Darwinula stevensoni TaxID=69355 RepID=A0A7R9FRX0_9CRUS|nr:unnamed protein product [Darwinula stevensoni]CAG0901777.1 unnamed protein product [Darwinula stevensoni]
MRIISMRKHYPLRFLLPSRTLLLQRHHQRNGAERGPSGLPRRRGPERHAFPPRECEPPLPIPSK